MSLLKEKKSFFGRLSERITDTIMLRGQVDPDEYVLVAATYDHGEFGKYIITSRSSLPLEMRPLQEKHIPLPILGDDLPYVYSIIDSIDACVTGQSVVGPQGFRRAK